MLWHWAKEKHGVKPSVTSDLVPWCIRYVAQLIMLTHVGDDGFTPYRRVTGRKKFPRDLVPWGAKVAFAIGGAKTKASLDKWDEGIFVGFHQATWEYVVLTPDGAVLTRDVKRLSDVDERDSQLFLAVRGLPWQKELPQYRLDLRMPVVSTPGALPPVPEGDRPKTHKVHIRAGVELKKFGYTDGCYGCAAARAGKRAQAHSEQCRERIEKAMVEDPQLSARIEQNWEKKDNAQGGSVSAAPGVAEPSTSAVGTSSTSVGFSVPTTHAPAGFAPSNEAGTVPAAARVLAGMPSQPAANAGTAAPTEPAGSPRGS